MSDHPLPRPADLLERRLQGLNQAYASLMRTHPTTLSRQVLEELIEEIQAVLEGSEQRAAFTRRR